jgi:hypothetical protein
MMISSLILNQYNLSTVLGRYLQAIRATVQKIIVYTIIRSYGAQKPRKERVVFKAKSQRELGLHWRNQRSTRAPLERIPLREYCQEKLISSLTRKKV